MTPEQRHLLEGVQRRAEHIRKYAELSLESDTLIPAVMAFMAWNLIRTLMLVCGDVLQHTVFQWVFGKLQDDAMLCTICGRLKPTRTAISCTECEAQFEQDDRDAEIQRIMDTPWEKGAKH